MNVYSIVPFYNFFPCFGYIKSNEPETNDQAQGSFLLERIPSMPIKVRHNQ
jgi:hypothetical protein